MSGSFRRTRVGVDPVLPADLDQHIRRTLEDILSSHAEAINENLYNTTAISVGTAVLNRAAALDLVLVDSTGTATLAVTLVPARLSKDRIVRVKKTSSGTIVLVVPTDGDMIDGSSTATLTTQYSVLTIMSDGDTWHKLHHA